MSQGMPQMPPGTLSTIHPSISIPMNLKYRKPAASNPPNPTTNSIPTSGRTRGGGYVDPNWPPPGGKNDAPVIIYGYTPSFALAILSVIKNIYKVLAQSK